MNEKVEEWYFFADKDLEAAEALLGRESLTNITAFHCQQAIEKYFKAFLAVHQINVPKLHDLDNLNDRIQKINKFEFDEETLLVLSQLYNDDRYPGGGIGLLPDALPSREEAEIFYLCAKNVEMQIKKSIAALEE